MKKFCLIINLCFLFITLGSKAQAQKTFADHWLFKGVAVSEPGYFLWGASPIEDEKGCIHLFIARWKIEHTFDTGWRSHSEIGHYVSDSPEGPFKFSDLALAGTGKETWDKYGIHNPAIHKVGNKYVLLYISNNNYKRPFHPSNQCIGMMTSNSLYGPWKKVGKDGLILSPSKNPKHWTYKASNGVNNPAFLQHPDGGFLLYFKSEGGKMGVAFAENLEGPYVMFPRPVTKNDLSIEDGYAFNWKGQICLLTTDNHGILEKGGGILWKSDNGIDFDKYESGFHVFPSYLPKDNTVKFKQNYGPFPKFERPQVLMREGQPSYLFVPSGANMFGDDETVVHVLKFEY